MDEIIAYVKKNLRIYTKPDGTIDYLSLNNDPSVFTAQNKLRVKSSLGYDSGRGSSQGRLSSRGNVRDSIESGQGYIRQDTRNRVPPNLVDKLEKFMIERNGVQYKVNVQERGNYEGRPL